jgi:sulfite exporter TauE/SafE
MGAIAYLQLFGIGLTFGFAGPCLFSCTPFLITYLAGKKLKWRQGLKEVLVFFSARLFAYLLLGYLAGLSATLLRRFGSSGLILLLKPSGGLIIILLGIIMLLDKGPPSCGCRFSINKAFTFSSLLVLGFISGIFPCAPLTALLFEITLVSKTALEGALCAFTFGLGTFVSGFIIISGVSRVISWLPEKVLKSELSRITFRIICSLLLILLGISFILI